MKEFYLNQHANDLKLAGSLRVMLWPQVFRTTSRDALTFAAIFLRLADRVLYHSATVWAQFYDDIRRFDHFPMDIPADARVATHDRTSKFEIEAFLAAAKALFEKNLVGCTGSSRPSLLQRGFQQHPKFLARVANSVAIANGTFFSSANDIRNHSCHVNPEFRDLGVEAWLVRAGPHIAVSIPNAYVDKTGSSVDLAQLFVSTHCAVATLMTEMRSTLFEFFVQHDGPLPNRTFELMSSRLGRQQVSIGVEGFEFSPFWPSKRVQNDAAPPEPPKPTP